MAGVQVEPLTQHLTVSYEAFMQAIALDSQQWASLPGANHRRGHRPAYATAVVAVDAVSVGAVEADGLSAAYCSSRLARISRSLLAWAIRHGAGQRTGGRTSRLLKGAQILAPEDWRSHANGLRTQGRLLHQLSLRCAARASGYLSPLLKRKRGGYQRACRSGRGHRPYRQQRPVHHRTAHSYRSDR